MASHKKTYFLVPSWDIPGAAISLGSIIADPTEPHRPLNSNAPIQPILGLNSNSDSMTNLDTELNINALLTSTIEPQISKIDTQVYKQIMAPYSTSLSTAKKNAFSLTAQLSMIFGIGGESSVTFATKNITSYHFRSMESEWFTPSAKFITSMVSQPDVAGNLGMLSSRKPVYMIIGVRRVMGVTAMSNSGKELNVGGGVNADFTPVGAPLNLGISSGRERSKEESTEWKCEGPIVFSYQLLKLRRKKEKWTQETYTKGAFMGAGDKIDDGLEDYGGDIAEGLDNDEVDVRDDGWDDLEGQECRVVVPSLYNEF
jgi:hypothetical protein